MGEDTTIRAGDLKKVPLQCRGVRDARSFRLLRTKVKRRKKRRDMARWTGGTPALTHSAEKENLPAQVQQETGGPGIFKNWTLGHICCGVLIGQSVLQTVSGWF